MMFFALTKKRSPLLGMLCCASVIANLIAATAQAEVQPESWRHNISAASPKPWTDHAPDASAEKFTFAVFSDLTGGERSGVFETAIEQLNLLRPEIIVNVGDLIEGDTTDPDGLAEQWQTFDNRAEKAIAPVFYAGGNHDLTGDALKAIWRERNGPTYYHFIYRDVLFLVLDTEDVTKERMAEIERIRIEGVKVYKTQGPEAFAQTEYANLPERTAGAISEEQSSYFQEVISTNPDVRWTFVLVHKQAWKAEGERNFAAIEAALAERPYTVFSGHVQAYGYEERHGRDYIQLATTGGLQFPDLGRSMDHVTLVTVDENGVDIANVLLSGILDKTGKIPGDGENICFEAAVCGAEK